MTLMTATVILLADIFMMGALTMCDARICGDSTSSSLPWIWGNGSEGCQFRTNGCI